MNWRLDQTKKDSAAPPGIELGSSDCRSDTLTTELRSHNRNCVRTFVFHQTVSSFFFFTKNLHAVPVVVSSHLSDRKKKEVWLDGMVPTGTNFRFEQLHLNPASFVDLYVFVGSNTRVTSLWKKELTVWWKTKICTQVLSWLRSSVARVRPAIGRPEFDTRRGCAVFCFC